MNDLIKRSYYVLCWSILPLHQNFEVARFWAEIWILCAVGRNWTWIVLIIRWKFFSLQQNLEFVMRVEKNYFLIFRSQLSTYLCAQRWVQQSYKMKRLIVREQSPCRRKSVTRKIVIYRSWKDTTLLLEEILMASLKFIRRDEMDADTQNCYA